MHTHIWPPSKITQPLGSRPGILWLETNIRGAEVSAEGTSTSTCSLPLPGWRWRLSYIPLHWPHFPGHWCGHRCWGVQPGSSSALAQTHQSRNRSRHTQMMNPPPPPSWLGLLREKEEEEGRLKGKGVEEGELYRKCLLALWGFYAVIFLKRHMDTVS